MSSNFFTSYGILVGNQLNVSSGTSIIYGNLGYNTTTGSGTISVLDGQTLTGSSISSLLNGAQSAYTDWNNQPVTTTSIATDINGITLTPGITQFTNPGGIAVGGSFTLNGSGTYILQVINGGITTNPTLASINIILNNSATLSTLYWTVNGNVTIQTIGSNVTNFGGTIICQGNVTIGAGSNNYGGIIAPNSTSNITLYGNTIRSQVQQGSFENSTPGYLTLNTTLADSQALKLYASNTYGGINMQAGTGGINIGTTNSIVITATNASNLTVTGSGNATLQAQAGLTNIDGVSGINIGTNTTYVTPTVNIGTNASSKTITVGNSSGTTSVNVNTGTGGFNANTASGGAISLNATGKASNFSVAASTTGQDLTLAQTGAVASRVVLSSAGTGTDSIYFNTANGGGITASVSGGINVATNSSAGITLNSTAGGGAINMTSGAAGSFLEASGGGAIGIGYFSGAQVLLGTNATGRPITIGNAITTSSLTRRWGPTGTLISTQNPEQTFGIVLTGQTLTAAQMLLMIATIAPSTNITLTLDTPTNIVTALTALSGIPGVFVNDSVNFSIINLSLTNSVTVTMPLGGTAIGNMVITSNSSASFRLRLTSVSITQTYNVYRLL